MNPFEFPTDIADREVYGRAVAALREGGVADFDQRKDQRFWTALRDLLPVWDEMIARFNRETGLGAG